MHVSSHLTDASISIIDTMHTMMQAWKRDVLSADEWRTMRVIVLGGSHMGE